MSFTLDLQFDVLTLVNEAQPSSILVISEQAPAFLDEYREQRQLINQNCNIKYISTADIDSVKEESSRYDLGLLLGALDNLDKNNGNQLLAHFRDVVCSQYCLLIDHTISPWQTIDLFAFALSKVNQYENADSGDLGLYKYNIDSYKRTPDWLNPDNWANPEMWNKYRW